MGDFGIENLPRRLPGLFQDTATILGIGIVPEIRTLIQKTFAFIVHYQREGIRVLLEHVAYSQVAEFRSIEVPGDRVTTGPVTPGRSADV